MSQQNTNLLATKEKVFGAADKLVSEGIKPTMTAVKAELGGGSFSTISPLLAQWREARRELDNINQSPVPDAVDTAVTNLTRQLWRVAQAEAENRVKGERQNIELAATEYAEREAELTQALDEAEEVIASLNGVVAEIKRELKEQIELSKKTDDALLLANNKAAAAEVRCGEIEQRANELRAELDKAHTARELAQVEAKKSEALLLSRIEVLELAKVSAIEAAKASELELSKLGYKLEVCESAVSEAERKRGISEQATAEANEKIFAYSNEAAAHKAVIEELRQQNAALTKQLAERNAKPTMGDEVAL